MEEETAPELIPALQDRIKEIGALLSNNLSLSALYINCSRINKIEGFCGKKMYLEITKKIQETIVAMKGKQIRYDDIIVANSAGSDEVTIFLSGKRDKGIKNNMLKQELIKAILNLSAKMNSMVIAEGIETVEELQVLKEIGVTIGQGFLFAKPGPAFPVLL